MTSSITNRRGFTLIEMMAVLAIMAILIIAALPSLRSVQSTGLQTGARQVANELLLARQYAVTRRLPVRFVLATGLTSLANNSNLICRAYTTCIATNATDPSDSRYGTPIGWIPLQDWRYLPDGVVFSDHNVATYDPINVAPILSTPAPTARYFNSGGSGAWQVFGNTGTLATYVSPTATMASNWYVSTVEFRPTGLVAASTLGSAASGGIRLAQGTVTDAATPKLLINNTNAWVYIQYDQYSGRVRVRYPESYQ